MIGLAAKLDSIDFKKILGSLILLCIVLILITPLHALGLSPEQKKLYDLNIRYFDLESCTSSGIGSVDGSISAEVGKGMSPEAQQKFQEILVAAGKKYKIDPNFVAAFYYAENARTGDSTNNADSASGQPATGDGNWREPPPPYGKGDPWASNSYTASGPFQFIDSTWASLGADGNGDGKKDVNDLADGAFGAANYMALEGGKLGASEQELHDAAFAYNHSETYVQSVLNTYKYLSGKGETDVSSSGGGSCGESGEAVTVDGYAWPVDIPKSEVDSGYPWPCKGNCHHDGTPAFDLSTSKANGGDDNDVVGRSEYAITDGTVTNLEIYNGISGCYSFQFKSSKDGYYYYYTHARNPTVKNNAKVKAGDKVAEVGERKCTGNGSYPHLHIDRGSPKGSTGGLECCRDAGMVDVMNKLYEALPDR